jgi:hypothetical protein
MAVVSNSPFCKGNIVLRSYDVKTVALALDVTPKWLDNLLSHHSLPGVTRERQGVERRISDEGVLAIDLVRQLAAFGVGAARAAFIAQVTLSTRRGSELRYVDDSGVILLFPAASIERRLRERMIDAIDAVASVRRGRPTRNS